MTDQAQLVKAFDTIRRVAVTSGKKDKERLLKQGDSEYLRRLCYLAYNKFQTYRILQIEQPTTYNTVQPDTMEEFEKLCALLASHTIGSSEAKVRIKNFLAKNTPDGAVIFTNVLLRDLRGGFDVKTVNKCFTGLVPVFNIQLGYALDSWDRIVFPVCVDEKIDGIRCVVVYDGTTVKFFSRNGFEFETGMEAFAEEIVKLVPGMPFVLDGEFRAHRFNPRDKTCQKHKKGNWQFEYAKGISRRKQIDPEEIRKYFKLYVWDVIDLEYFESQGLRGEKLPLDARKIRLQAMFDRHEIAFNMLEVVPSFVMHNKAEVMAYMRELKLKRLEGCMLKPLHLPYSFSKNYTIIKLKHFVEGDFRIVGAYEAEKGSKYEGLLGGVTIATDDGLLKSNMGSGFSDEQRADLWVEYLAGRLTGQIVEIQFKDITADGSLQLPTLNRFREDKDETNTYAELMAKIEVGEEE